MIEIRSLGSARTGSYIESWDVHMVKLPRYRKPGARQPARDKDAR
jgi:hypothetical protein